MAYQPSLNSSEIEPRKSVFKIENTTFVKMYNLMIFHTIAISSILATATHNYVVAAFIYLFMVFFFVTFYLDHRRKAASAELLEALTFSINAVLILCSLIQVASNFEFQRTLKDHVDSYITYS